MALPFLLCEDNQGSNPSSPLMVMIELFKYLYVCVCVVVHLLWYCQTAIVLIKKKTTAAVLNVYKVTNIELSVIHFAEMYKYF